MGLLENIFNNIHLLDEQLDTDSAILIPGDKRDVGFHVIIFIWLKTNETVQLFTRSINN